jgi:hypothetical protein
MIDLMHKTFLEQLHTCCHRTSSKTACQSYEEAARHSGNVGCAPAQTAADIKLMLKKLVKYSAGKADGRIGGKTPTAMVA